MSALRSLRERALAATGPLAAAGPLVPAGLLVAAAILPKDQPLPFDLCLWHRMTGLRCLTCGLTRSVCHLMHGDLAGSLALHPAGVLATALLIVLALRPAIEAARGVRAGFAPPGGPSIRRRG